MSSIGATAMPWRASTLRSYFRFCPILRQAGSASTGRRPRARPRRDLARRPVAAAEQVALPRDVRQRHIGRAAGRERQRDADDFGRHLVERGGLESMQSRPVAEASAAHSASRSGSVMVSWPAASIGGISITAPGRRPRPPRAGRRMRRSRPPGPRASASRRCAVSERNSISRRKAKSGSGSGASSEKSAGSCIPGTSRLSVTRSRERRIWSALSIRVWRRLGCLISSARASSVSMSP